MIRALTALACLAVAASCSPAANDATASATALAPPPPVTQPIDVESFTPQQQADLRAVVRDYLVRDPTVLREALETLAARERAEREQQIVNDPRSYSVGPANAPVTIVEFFDYKCPYCHAALEWVFHTIRTRNDVRVIFKEYPVLGDQSTQAARAAIASIKQGRYQQFHQGLMSFRGPLTDEALNQIAQQSGIDVARMRRDMESDSAEIDAIISQNYQHAAESSINGTPAFLINGEWVRGWPRGGAAELTQMVDDAARQARTRQASR